MSKLLTPGHGRIVLQICAMTAVAALMSGCSADSTRFGDAFGNPFTTGSIQQKPKKVAHATSSMGTGHTPAVTASALPPSNHVAVSSPSRAEPVSVSRETTGSIPSSTPVKGASFGGWTGQGGASVQVGAGDSAAVLAQRYGVPENVLLQTNGLHAAGEIHPGTTIVIPIYNAVAGAPRVAQAAPVRSEPVEPEERSAPVKTVPAHVARAEPEEEPARKPASLPFKVDKPATLAERNAEAQRIVATQRAADKLAADKLAVSQKAAEAQKLAEARKAKAAEEVAAAEQAKADAAARKVAAKAAPASHADLKVAAAAKAAAAQKLTADREAAAAKAEAATATKAAAAAAKAAKLAAAKPAPAAAAVAKPEKVAAVDKKVDPTPTASLPPPAVAAAPAAPVATPVVADAGGPEFRWPARGRIIAGFKGGSGGNDGINIAVPEGTQVKAAEGGVVAYAGSELKGYGNLVLIRHPNGYVTAYANNGEIDVKRGETVKRGDVIAKSGQSGNVSSPQLHFEVRKGSTPVDPTGMLAGT